MHVGLTYDLRSEYLAEGYSEEETAEFDRDDTIDALEEAIAACAHHVERVGRIDHLVERLAAGDRWDLVFNIAEGLYGVAREAQVPALLDAFQIPYTFADPAVLVLCLDKALCKAVMREAGLPTAPWQLVRSPDDCRRLGIPFPVFVKPVAEGTGKGITDESLVADPSALARVCRRLLKQYQQPVLVEPYLAGREFTVGILGTGDDAQVLGTLEIVLRRGAEACAYSYANKERCEDLVEYRLVGPENDPAVAEAERIALAAWRVLGCRDGGRLDLRCNPHGRPQLLEANPLAGLHPQHSDLPMLATAVGMSYQELIERILRSAAARAGPACRGILQQAGKT